MTLTSDSAQAAAGGPAPAVPASLPVRVVQIIVSPAQLFDRLKDRPLWATALLLGALMVVVSVVAIPTDVWAEYFRAQMLEAGQPVPEGLEGGGAVFRIFGMIGGVLFWGLWTLLVAGLTTFMFAFVLGDDVRFRQVLSATSHSLLIVALGGLLVLPLRLARRDPELVLSVGTFLPFFEGYPAAFLGSLDLFALWAFALLGLAMTRFDSRRSPGVAITALLGVFLALNSVLAIFRV